MKAEHSDALVFFGASGDLAYKQIFPALLALVKDGRLDVPVIGVAKSNWNLDQLKARAKDSIEKSGAMDIKAFDKLSSLLNYIDGDYGDATTFTKLRQTLGESKRPLYYLAIPPDLFGAVADGLKKADCVEGARVVVEKPFGHDLASARELNKTLHQFFPEQNIFRIDHFLGKEPVQNLIYFRFANPVVEACWNNRHIESVQITMAEKFGVAGRGKLYDEEGAIRDVVQNHMMQVIACLAMECPAASGPVAGRDQRARLLKAVRTLGPKDVVRGQYSGYRSEPGVAPDSQVETYAALRFYIDNERWQGVPFFVRVGKCLPVTATEAVIRFKHAPNKVLDEACLEKEAYYRFRVSPNQVIALGLKVKKPGELMVGKSAELIAHQKEADEMPPYERLLGDAMIGDATLFVREDAVEEAWRIVDPVLNDVVPVAEYEPDTWGPVQVSAAFEPEGGWSDPQAIEDQQSTTSPVAAVAAGRK
jgi:glucose-6-phosphate 1-dehydrogenase